MSDLDRLLKVVRDAPPAVRIEYRDQVAVHGARAVPSLRSWLSDPRLGAFATRTLEKIAAEPADRPAVLAALESVNRQVIPQVLTRDIGEAIARLRGAPRRTGTHSTARQDAAVEHWAGARAVSALELRFHDDMLDIFRLAGEATRRRRADGTVARGYWASYFLRGVRNHGGPEYARQLLRKAGTTPGFQRLKEEGHLDLTMEALVLKPEYASLFSDEERAVAARRLTLAGYQPGRG